VIEGDRFAEYGLPDVRDWPQMADMVLVAKDGYAFSNTADEERWVAPNTAAGTSIGSHGFLSTDPKMNAIFVASGAGLRKGVTLEGVENIDVAPTIAQLLGIQLDNVEGKVLKEALVDGK
jgi:predicted AlkP superfamily pyrophosphatase or phosphodiesterase